MKYTATLITIAVCACSFAGQGAKFKPMAAPMSASMAKKTDWKAMYKEAEKAFGKMDAAAITKYMTADCTMTSMGHTMNKQQAVASLKQWFGMMKNLHATMNVTKVVEKGDTAMVTDTFHMWGMSKPEADKKSHRYDSSGTETATWVRKNGMWMMKMMVAQETMKRDGKAFNPGG